MSEIIKFVSTAPTQGFNDEEKQRARNNIGAANQEHDHDDRYYTEAEIDEKLSNLPSGSDGYKPPVGGIPKEDLSTDVQESLNKADTALQEHQDISNKVDKVAGKGLSTNDYTNDEKTKLAGITNGATANVGTITEIKMNGVSKGTSGIVDLGNVLTEHPSISTQQDSSSSVSPSHSQTFTVIDSVSRDKNGHVTKVNTKTVTLPTSDGTSGGSDVDVNPLLNEYLSPNRLAGVYPKGVSIEYSRDGGKTWKDYGTSDIDKRRLFTTRSCAFRIGGPASAGNYTSNGRLRITLKTGAANVYTVLERLHIYASTAFSQDCKITIKAAYESEPDNYVKTIVEDMPFDGWPDWKMINLTEYGGAITTYGNDPSWQFGRIKFEFSAGELFDKSQTEYGFQVISIFGYGGVGWETPTNMALSGHAYTYDADMAVEFPSTVYADGGFIGMGTYLTELNVDNVEYGVLSIEHGGTGATTLEELRENLGASSDEVNYLINGGQKNVLAFISDNVLTTNGITFAKLANGEIVANGTATSSAFYKSNDFMLPEGDYILNGGAKGGASDKWSLQRYVNGSVVDNIYDDETSIAFTSDASKTFSVYVVIRSGQTVSNLTFKPMIRKAIISDDTFAPYAPTNKELYDTKASQDEMNFIMNGNQKNQFGIDIADSIAWGSSITYSKVSECEYTLTATATSSSDLVLFNTDNDAYKNLYGLENIKYILTANNPNVLFTVDISTNGTSWGTSTYPNWQNAPINFDLSKAKGVRIRCRLKKGTSLNNADVKFMLRPSYIKDDTFVSYAPSNRELYDMILAIKSAQANISQLDENKT